MNFDFVSAEIRVNRSQRFIRRGESEVRLGRKAFAALGAFLESPQIWLSDEELWTKAYPESEFDPINLTSLIRILRKNLGDSLIETRPRTGSTPRQYRWSHSVFAILSVTNVNESLLGHWIECIPGQPDRPLSLSQFSFSDDGGLVYSGTNYTKDGEPYYSWRSCFVKVDAEQRTLVYVYSVHRLTTLAANYGFGFFRLAGDPTNLQLKEGYFIDAEEKDSQKQAILLRRAHNFDAIFSRTYISDFELQQLAKKLLSSHSYFNTWLKDAETMSFS